MATVASRHVMNSTQVIPLVLTLDMIQPPSSVSTSSTTSRTSHDRFVILDNWILCQYGWTTLRAPTQNDSAFKRLILRLDGIRLHRPSSDGLLRLPCQIQKRSFSVRRSILSGALRNDTKIYLRARGSGIGPGRIRVEIMQMTPQWTDPSTPSGGHPNAPPSGRESFIETAFNNNTQQCRADPLAQQHFLRESCGVQARLCRRSS